MADFRQLALEFVLADDPATQTSLAKQASREIKNESPGSNPVARWVESVQPWMPGSGDDDITLDNGDTPDWTARAKSLEFLARTLDFLDPDVLKPSQVKLLVAFFGAMFDVDHKAGVFSSASALSRIVSMKSFQGQSGLDIMQKICLLKDDFPRQVAKTRLAVYELLKSLVSMPSVRKDLQLKQGEEMPIVGDLLSLCANERDPACLLIWFETLRTFLSDYSMTLRIQEEIFSTYKLYFPITLPRASQSGITPEQLKSALRMCFSATPKLAHATLPFLTAKLDQGDGVTLNVKVDVLKTIKACLESYSQLEKGCISPYVNSLWSSLKYEVRNGEIEESIWATLEVLKTIAVNLEGDALRDYILTVTRDCVNDLSNPIYTSSAGRLLVSVLSASRSAFALMVSPALTHVKENLRHPKSPTHTQELLKALHVILETRLLLVDTDLTPQEQTDFAAVDAGFKTLYEDVYLKPLQDACRLNRSEEDMKTSVPVVQGAGALACQRQATVIDPFDDTVLPTLLPESVCLQICETLFAVVQSSLAGISRHAASDELINETTKSLQRAVKQHPNRFQPLANQAIGIMRSSWKNQDQPLVETTQSLGPLLAYVGCSELPTSAGKGLDNFLYYILALARELDASLEVGVTHAVCSAFCGGIHSAVRYFSEASNQLKSQNIASFTQDTWVTDITTRFPSLRTLDTGNYEDSGDKTACATAAEDVGGDFLLIGLFVARHFYRKATALVVDGAEKLSLAASLNDASNAEQHQYLYLLSTLAGFIVHELSEEQQLSLGVESLALNLFHDEIGNTSGKETVPGSEKQWDWLVLEGVNVLSFGILESLRPRAVSKIFDSGIGPQLILSGCSEASHANPWTPVATSILSVLANKYPVESSESLLALIEQRSNSLTSDSPSVGLIMPLYSIAAGLLRRNPTKPPQTLLALIRNASAHELALAQGVETIVAPHRYLTKESFAVVKLLWMQRTYNDLVKAMLTSIPTDNPVARTSAGIGTLHMLKHMPFAIYEGVATAILRLAISTAQTMPLGSDSLAALSVLKQVLIESPSLAKDHVRSIVNLCIASFSPADTAATSANTQDWLPAGYVKSQSPEDKAACGKIALEIAGGLPRLFETVTLLPFARQMERKLTLACGHGVRDLRKLARQARAAWTEVK